MRKYLLPNGRQSFKANLHCHTNMSDGHFTPAQIKDEYKKRGYSVVAYTDHNLFLDRSELKDDDFLPLNGYEMDFTETHENAIEKNARRTCHINLIALNPETTIPVCLHRTKYMFGNVPENATKMNYGNEEDFEREYSASCVNHVIKEAKEKGFFVAYNHPTWSLENYPLYTRYENYDALELLNYGCITEGYCDINTHCYDDLLLTGKRISVVAGDDNHNWHPLDDPYNDSFGAFTIIKADKLDYKSVTDALVYGDTYVSMGPEINELYVEDGVITIRTSPASKIIMATDNRKNKISAAAKDSFIEEASFKYDESVKYVRFVVTDSNGLSAYTRAYFIDEL